MDEEDPFLLPNASNHVPSNQELHFNRLQSRLSDLKKEKLHMKNKLAEEKLTYLMTTSFASAIPDPRKQKAMDMQQVQEKIMDQLSVATESRLLQEVLSNFRLSGCTTFTFQGSYIGIRLETFYDRRYYEPYYLFLPKNNPSIIKHHTFPPFIPTTQIEQAFLPDNIDSMLRLLQDFLLAYVSRREQIKALENHIDKKTVKIEVLKTSKLSIDIIQPKIGELRYYIKIQYKNLASMYPDEVTVNILDQDHNLHDFDEVMAIVDAFKTKRLLQAYTSFF